MHEKGDVQIYQASKLKDREIALQLSEEAQKPKQQNVRSSDRHPSERKPVGMTMEQRSDQAFAIVTPLSSPFKYYPFRDNVRRLF